MLNWLSKLFGGAGAGAEAGSLYETVMEGALSEILYREGLAADTFEGRFECVTLHSVLMMRHLRVFGKPGQKLADQLYRRVFDGFDHALRERGTGDSSIARKVRGFGERFFGLARAVDAALDAAEPASELSDVLQRNAIGGGAQDRLVAYLLQCEKQLSALELVQFQSGEIDWPVLHI